MEVYVVSARRAYPPPLVDPKWPSKGYQSPPTHGLLWCPYCVKWREFEESAVRVMGNISPDLFRCPICTISIMDHYVNLYNPEMVIRLNIASESKGVRVSSARVRKPKDPKKVKGGVRRRRRGR